MPSFVRGMLSEANQSCNVSQREGSMGCPGMNCRERSIGAFLGGKSDLGHSAAESSPLGMQALIERLRGRPESGKLPQLATPAASGAGGLPFGSAAAPMETADGQQMGPPNVLMKISPRGIGGGTAQVGNKPKHFRSLASHVPMWIGDGQCL